MIKKTFKYVDYNGNERTEDHYFNLTKAEVTDMELSINGGMNRYIERIVEAQDHTKIMDVFKQIIDRSYGQKSLDGRRFVKNDDILTEFKETEAYDILYMELATDDKSAAEFINGVLPKGMGEIKPNANPNNHNR